MLKQSGVLFYILLILSTLLFFKNIRAQQTVFSEGDYEITQRQEGTEWVYTLYDKSCGSYIEVYQLGGLIKTFVADVEGTQYSVFKSGRGNPKMMPWPNRVEDGVFTDSDGNTYDLLASGQTSSDGQGNAIHGVVQDKMWTADEYGANEEGVFIRCYFDTEGFDAVSDIFGNFRDYSVYTLKGSTLLIDSYTMNTSDSVFDNCGWGWHPWLNVPLVPVDSPQLGSRERCSLLMPAASIAMVDYRKIPTGVLESTSDYENGAYDFRNLRSLDGLNVDHFFTDLTPENELDYTRTVYIDYGNEVRIQYFGQYPAYPWMVIYTTNSDFVCIEHQTEEVNGLNTHQNLISIPPGSTSHKARTIIQADKDTTLTYNPAVSCRMTAPVKTRIRSALKISGRRVQFKLDRQAHVKMTLYNLKGKTVSIPVNGIMSAGLHSVNLKGRDRVNRGIYTVSLYIGKNREVIRYFSN